MLVIASLHAEWTHHLPRNPMQASNATIQAETTLKYSDIQFNPLLLRGLYQIAF